DPRQPVRGRPARGPRPGAGRGVAAAALRRLVPATAYGDRVL
ncbi:MAG: hypothetical protein AVDCRST_MAG47-1003, partial [uncultured Nocardioidaceae bacterium]